ncbi:glycosyltransferase [Streptacidiphilus rugosus]|uniref:glycosyltransferase n=1 Tax=Streptacidiphilus rugosus TaxID=405783 RepID=UPI000ABAECCC|nr:glycosyltransferase [Streptacidiphilus rugosus]
MTREDISLVIPAHNEERVIGRLLDALLADGPDGLDIVVVCNGCSDGTAEAARGHGPAVRVVELEKPSKHWALRAGDEHALTFPRLYVDADVVLSGADARRVAAALDTPGILAAAPERELPLAASDWRVRAFYRVWLRLPTVRQSLFGRGVLAVSEAGHARLAALPELMADDLAFSLAFRAEERRVAEDAHVVIQPPRSWPDLMRRRIRAMTSTAQLEHHQRSNGVAAEGDAAGQARTGLGDLRALVRAEPRLLPSVVVFAATAVLARRAARRAVRAGDFDTWLRDESSRS